MQPHVPPVPVHGGSKIPGDLTQTWVTGRLRGLPSCGRSQGLSLLVYRLLFCCRTSGLMF